MTVPAPAGVSPEHAALLRAARAVVALTGAGISKESGLPTFREAQTGLWSQYRPEELATPEAFARQPDLVWQWYAWRRALVRQAAPNAAHRALVSIAERAPSFALVTQNVDGLHRRAGSSGVIELHGDILRSRCSACGAIARNVDDASPSPPPCAACGAPVRPDVVWFGEALPEAALQSAIDAARSCDLLLVIGTSLQVRPAASLLPIALDAGAQVLNINPDADVPGHPRVHTITGAAAKVLPALVSAAWP